MRVEQIRAIARQRGLKTGKLRKNELIKAIQRDEGNEACYSSGRSGTCEQNACLWRQDCIEPA